MKTFRIEKRYGATLALDIRISDYHADQLPLAVWQSNPLLTTV